MAIGNYLKCIERCLLRSSVISSRRSIAMTSSNLEKVLEKLQQNPYYDKYAERIAEVQRRAPDRLARLQPTEPSPAPSPAPSSDSAPLRVPDTRQYSSVLNPKKTLEDPNRREEKTLDSLLKLDLIRDKNANEIQQIWEEYHKERDVICAVIPCAQYTVLSREMERFPTFLFPLPRAHGYEFIMSQCSGRGVHFTPLLAYQVHKENAPECLTMHHYTELSDKGIILMRGEYDKNVINVQEAQCLGNQFQLYYSERDVPKSQLLQTFNERPQNFRHMDLIEQLENITII